jgi:hypothetical protein
MKTGKKTGIIDEKVLKISGKMAKRITKSSVTIIKQKLER